MKNNKKKPMSLGKYDNKFYSFFAGVLFVILVTIVFPPMLLLKPIMWVCGLNKTWDKMMDGIGNWNIFVVKITVNLDHDDE